MSAHIRGVKYGWGSRAMGAVEKVKVVPKVFLLEKKANKPSNHIELEGRDWSSLMVGPGGQ